MSRAELNRLNPLDELHMYGQSFWLDYIRRSLITSGELLRMVNEDGLRGVNSNPMIFQKAIAGSSDYDKAIAESINRNIHLDAPRLFEELAIKDTQAAADILRSVYIETKRADGFVSFELAPHLAHDATGSIAEAHRLWKLIDRPNVMLKIPGTSSGIPVIEALIAAGINVNVTLLFSLSQYEAVANAYLRGLERCSDPSRVASVASFFLSRIDRVVDKELDEIGTLEALQLKGKIAVANAKIVYQRFKEFFSDERWKVLIKRGAKVQRILWASTSTKNPAYSDLLYVEDLIGPSTVNTMPPVTSNAFRDHGQVAQSVEARLDAAQSALNRLSELGIDLEAITQKLQEDGENAFAESFDKLLSTLEEKRQALIHGQEDLRIMKLGRYQIQVDNRLQTWEKNKFLRRMWEKDPTLWFPTPMPEISDRLGWLNLPEMMHEQLEDLIFFADEVRAEGIRHVILLGMGGSSLASEVLWKTFGHTKDFPSLIVLDSTHPSAVKAVEKEVDLHRTLFIVSSKSGTTIETLSLSKYFWRKVDQAGEDPGRHFVAITDTGTSLETLAVEKGYRRVFHAPSDVGGRYSALSVFGLVPAALIGMDVHKFLDRAWVISESCAFCVSSREAAGLILGAAIGELTKMGRDKMTVLTSSSLNAFPVWVEQLIAESTGKDGKGIIPVVNEPIIQSDLYGTDRFFVIFYSEQDNTQELQQLTNALEAMGHPIIQIKLTEIANLSQEIFSWEIAVASAGAILGIHPFDQPSVQMAKDIAKKLMEQAEKGELQKDDEETVSVEDPKSLAIALERWLSQAQKEDYLAIQAYLAPTSDTSKALQQIQLRLLERLNLATTFGYGPRFLHSTGQLHKGGPTTGLFLQLIDEPPDDEAVPETNYTFGKLIAAQSRGDYAALKKLDRRILRINLKGDVPKGLSCLAELIKKQKG